MTAAVLAYIRPYSHLSPVEDWFVGLTSSVSLHALQSTAGADIIKRCMLVPFLALNLYLLVPDSWGACMYTQWGDQGQGHSVPASLRLLPAAALNIEVSCTGASYALATAKGGLGAWPAFRVHLVCPSSRISSCLQDLSTSCFGIGHRHLGRAPTFSRCDII